MVNRFASIAVLTSWILFLQGMTEVNKFADVKELERKQWLADLGILIRYSETCVKYLLSKD